MIIEERYNFIQAYLYIGIFLNMLNHFNFIFVLVIYNIFYKLFYIVLKI